MKQDALKLKISNFAYNLIDKVFPKGDFMTAIGNATAKFYIDQNISKMDSYLSMFADSSGDIDTKRFLELLEGQIFNDNKLKLNEYIPEQIRRFVPCDVYIDKEDVKEVLGVE